MDLNKISDDAEHTRTHKQMNLLDNEFSEMETQPSTQIYATILSINFYAFSIQRSKVFGPELKITAIYTVKN